MDSSESGAGQPSLDRPTLTRRSYALGATALVVGASGCLDRFGGADDDGGDDDGEERFISSADPLSAVPAGIDGIVFLDGPVPEDQETVALLDDLIAGGSGVGAGETSYVNLLSAFSSLEEYESATAFYRVTDTDDYAVMLVATNGASDAVIEEAKDQIDGLAEVGNDDRPVYHADGGGRTERVAQLDETLVAIGTEPAVTQATETFDGDRDAFDGELRETFVQAPEGRVVTSMNLQGDELFDAMGEISPELSLAPFILPDIHMVTAVYPSFEPEVPVVLQLSTASPEDAHDAKETLGAFVEDDGQDPDEDERPVDERPILERMTLDQQGRHLVIEVLMTPDEIVQYFDVYASALAAELGNEDAL